MSVAISSLFWALPLSRASWRNWIAGKNANSLPEAMTSPDQNPEQLNAAILTWTHQLAPHGIFTTDRELRITSWNHWLESQSSLRAEDVLGRQLLDIIPSLPE